MKTTIALGIFVCMFIAVHGQENCTYEKPEKELEKCAETAISTVNDNAGGTTNETTPDITSPNFAKWFCGGKGLEMITCADGIMEKCKDKLQSDVTFNVRNGYQALRRCRDVDESDLPEMYRCISNMSDSTDFVKCAFRTVETVEKSLTYDCMRHAHIYNCYVDHAVEKCGSNQVSFFIAITRMMEPRKCQDVIDAAYREPVSMAQTLTYSTLLTLVSGLVFLLAL